MLTLTRDVYSVYVCIAVFIVNILCLQHNSINSMNISRRLRASNNKNETYNTKKHIVYDWCPLQ